MGEVLRRIIGKVMALATATTFFDVQAVDSDANSYMLRAVLSSIEHTEKKKYSQAAETINASFTPFV